MYHFTPDNIDNGSQNDVRMIDARDGGPVGRIVEHKEDGCFVGHFDAFPGQWPVSHPDMEGAQRLMTELAMKPQVQARIS